MKNSYRRERTWTPAEEKDLRAWYEGGLDFDTIGFRLGRGPMGVRSKIHKCGFKRLRDSRGKPWTDEQVATLTRMWGENRSTPAIAAAIERSESSIFDKAHGLGLGPRDFGRAKRTATETPKLESPWHGGDENVAAKLRELQTARFLIDFKRAGYSAAYYKSTCEMPAHAIAVEPCLYHNEQPRPRLADFRTFISSTAAMCAEVN